MAMASAGLLSVFGVPAPGSIESDSDLRLVILTLLSDLYFVSGLAWLMAKVCQTTMQSA